MATGTVLPQTEGDISTCNRLLRGIAALMMVGYPMLIDGTPIGIIALFPLIAIYPMHTALVGWDPIKFLVEVAELQGQAAQVQWVARSVLALIGIVMISATLLVSGEVGWYGLLALLGIVPVFIAILGENPVEALRESSRQLRDTEVHDSRCGNAATVNGSMDETDPTHADEPRSDRIFARDKAA